MCVNIAREDSSHACVCVHEKILTNGRTNRRKEIWK